MGVCVTLALSSASRPARADIWGGDVAVLTQILAENIKFYYQLKEIISLGENQRDFLRVLNSGIDNLGGLLSVMPIRDQKILEDLRTFQQAANKIQALYGSVPASNEAGLQLLNDQTVAESIKLLNDSKTYADQQEQNASRIIVETRTASPKGAARIGAQTSAEILQTLNQLVRLNSQMLKLQSQQLAVKNKEGKDSVKHFQKIQTDVNDSMKSYNADLGFPKF